MNTPYPPNQPDPENESYTSQQHPTWESTPTAPQYPVWPGPSASPDEQMIRGNETRSYTIGDTRAEVQHQTLVDANGNVIHQRNTTYDNSNQRRANLKTLLLNISSFLTGALMTLLGLRFFFQLLGADAANSLVAGIYHSSQPFILVFNGIFANHQLGEHGIFETSTLIAIPMYFILAAGVQAVIRMVLAPHHNPHQISRTTQELRRW